MKSYQEQIDELETELAEVHNALRPFWDRANNIEGGLTRLRSLDWIQRNGVSKENVEPSSGDGKPYFTIVHEFVKWIQANSTKPFAEWNGRICRVSQLIDGTASLCGPGRFEDLV